MSKVAFAINEVFAQSVEHGAKNTLVFPKGTLFEVDDEIGSSKTGDVVIRWGILRFVPKQFVVIYEKKSNFLRLEDAVEVVKVGMALLTSGNRISPEVQEIMKVAWNVLEDHFVNNVFDDDEEEEPIEDDGPIPCWNCGESDCIC